ncbi:MAG: hypothetical protein KDB23_01350, partial [Planctomycetales bacterium]|nr:hypothetical protein [Planctomycetales bacterium]
DRQLLLEKCRESQPFTGLAYILIGFDELVHGRRETAASYFKMATETGDFQASPFWWSRAFFSRAEDPSWLPWLTE